MSAFLTSRLRQGSRNAFVSYSSPENIPKPIITDSESGGILINIPEEIFDATSIGQFTKENENSIELLPIELLPEREPYVSIEAAPSNARRIFTGVDIMADMESIWDVLTTFERLQDVVPSLVKNEVNSSNEIIYWCCV